MKGTVKGGDLNSLSRLKTSHPRPEEGEEIPITFIDMREVFAGWSPELKRTVYKNDFRETTGLKRLREVILLEVYNWLLEGISFIELSEMERSQFKEILDQFIEKGGEIHYMRKKQNNWIINYFRLVEDEPSRTAIKEISMEKLLEKDV